jgi:hypothetical protein
VATRSHQRQQAVFLNVPFDEAYEPQFLALVAGIVALGRTPRCVLELPDAGQGRLERLIRHIGGCGASIHELSRVGPPARFNMPFELGLACAIARLGKRPHSYFLLHNEPYRLDRVLSDLKGCDHVVHNGTVRGTIHCVCDVLRKPRGSVKPQEAYALYRELRKVADALKRGHGARTIYSRSIFEEVVIAATKLAADRGLI